MTLDLTQWLEILNGVGTFGLLIAAIWYMNKTNTQKDVELKAERSARIVDLKAHNTNSESLLEKVLVALRDNQRFLETSLNTNNQSIKEELSDVKVAISSLQQEIKVELNTINNKIDIK